MRGVPELEWPGAIHAELRRLIRAGETEWTARHVAYCLEERLLRVHKLQGCGAHLGGGHECVLGVAHAAAHRCACGKVWPKRL